MDKNDDRFEALTDAQHRSEIIDMYKLIALGAAVLATLMFLTMVLPMYI